jgi:hypothetical protein
MKIVTTYIQWIKVSLSVKFFTPSPIPPKPMQKVWLPLKLNSPKKENIMLPLNLQEMTHTKL